MYEIETALLYFQDGTKQFTDQRETSLCVTFVGMFLLREALNKFLLHTVTDKQKQNEIKDILFYRSGKLSLSKWQHVVRSPDLMFQKQPPLPIS